MLDVSFGATPLSGIVEKLSAIATAQQGLRGLGVTLASYSMELLHAIGFLYPNLQALRIMYEKNPPSEVNVSLLSSIRDDTHPQYTFIARFAQHGWTLPVEAPQSPLAAGFETVPYSP
jgi:hypothetical protein